MESSRDVLIMSENELIWSPGCRVVARPVTELIIFTTLCLTIGVGSWVRFSGGGLAVWEFWYVSLSQLDRRQRKSIRRTSFKTAWRSIRRKIDKNLVLVLIDLLCILWSNIYILNWPKHKLYYPFIYSGCISISKILIVEEKWHQGWRLANLRGIVDKLSVYYLLQIKQDWLTIRITSYFYPFGWDQMNTNW